MFLGHPKGLANFLDLVSGFVFNMALDNKDDEILRVQGE